MILVVEKCSGGPFPEGSFNPEVILFATQAQEGSTFLAPGPVLGSSTSTLLN